MIDYSSIHQDMATVRELMCSNLSDRQILNKLRGLHVGVNIAYWPWDRFINGSMWTIGATAPTLEWVKTIRKHIDDIDSLTFSGMDCWLDRPLTQHKNWERSKTTQNLVIEMFQQRAFY